MKKIFFLMLALLGCAVQGWADKVTDLSQLDNDKVYTIRSERAFLLFSDKMPGELCSSTGKSVGSVTYSLTDPNLQFSIQKDGSSYYLFSVGAQKYVGQNGAYTDAPSAALTIEKLDNASYPWKMCVGGQGLNTQAPNQTNSGIAVNSWTTTDAGNCFYIEEAVPEDKVYNVVVLGTDNAEAGFTYGEATYKNGATIETKEVIKASDVTAVTVEGMFALVTVEGMNIYVSYLEEGTKFYTLQGGHGGYVSMNSEYMRGENFLLTNTNRPRDNKSLWFFVKAGTNKYKVYNYSKGLSKALGIKGTEADARAAMVAEDNTEYKIVFSGKFNFGSNQASVINIDGTGHYWNKRGDFLALWQTSEGTALNDTGCKFFIVEVDAEDYPETYYNEVKNIAGVSEFSPKNPNTLWYKTSAEATGVSYPWMEYALPLGNGELGCMVFGGVYNEEIQFNEKTLWSGAANQVGAGGGQRTFMNFGSVFVENKDKAIWNGVIDYVRYLDIEEGIAGVEFKNANGSKFSRKYLSSAPDQVIAAQYKAEGEDKMNLVPALLLMRMVWLRSQVR